MLRDAADDRAERPREEKEVASRKRRQQPNRYAGGIDAEGVVCGEQHDADEPDHQHGRRADGPAQPVGLFAGEGADADVEADPVERRGNRLDHHLEENERHASAPFSVAWPIPAAGVRLRDQRAPISAKIEMMSIMGLLPSCRSGWLPHRLRYCTVPMMHIRYCTVPP